MKNIRLLLIILLSAITLSYGQTTLAEGDIALIGMDTPGEDFMFVTFVNLDAGTEIYFTDEEADNDFTIGGGEGTVLYTAPAGGILAGTVISYTGNATNFTTTTDGLLALGNNGDGIIAYQGPSVGNVTTFLHAIGEDAGDMGTFPGGFTNFLLIGADDGEYGGPRTGGTPASYLTAINDVTNWTTNGTGVIPFDLTFFTFGPLPTTIDFVNTSSTLAEDGVFIDICVAITNEDATNATTIEIALSGASTATNGVDYDDGAGTPAAITFPQTLTFPAGSNTNQCLTIYISNDDSIFETSEDVILNIQNPAGGNSAALGTDTQHILTIVDNDFSSAIMITQYYEGTATNKWVEIKNISGVVIPANTFYLLMLNNADADNPAAADPSAIGSPSFSNNILISTDMAIDEVRRFREPTAVLPSYASPGEPGYDGNPTFNLPNGPFSGDDIVLISTTNDNTTWANRVDVIGDGTLWGDRQCFIRNECIANGPSINFDINDWLIFTDTEVESPVLNTNPYLGQHFQGATTFDSTFNWDNGSADRSRILVLDEDYDTAIYGNIEGCSLIVNPTNTLTVNDNSYVEIENDVTNNGIISVLTDGSFVQNSDSATFTNSINDNSTVTKLTAPIDAWYEYTYWSSPVQGEVMEDTFFGTNIDRRYLYNSENYKDSFAESMNNNDTTTTGQDDVDDDANDWQLYTSGTMQPGVGYACTLSVASFNASGGMSGVGVPGSQFAHIFAGPFNNGIFNIPIYKNDSEMNDTNWNFIGNPYPSAISVDDFFTLNTYNASTNPTGTIEGAVYLWSQDTAPSGITNGNSALNFDNSDYAIINIVGSTGALEVAGGDTVLPARYIPSGQGFFVSYDNAGASVSSSTNTDGDIIETGEVIFNNSLRVSGNNDQFFRNSNTQSITGNDNKLWLEFTSDTGIYGQILVGYVPNATDEDDGMSYDAPKNTATGYPAYIYSTITGSDKKYGIQGKKEASLTIDEEIPFGLYTTITEATLYKISILQLEGDFLNTNTIFLEDTLMNTVHNLSNSDYTFTSANGEFNERFKIVFNTNTLSTQDNINNTNSLSIVELQNDNVKFILNGELTIKSVKIIDVLGRELYHFSGSQNIEIYNLSKLSNTTYIAQIQLSNGMTISKKAVKR